MNSFDVIVIGTGSAGATVAKIVRKAGKRVAIIDKLPFGGTCSQRGCDPKKVLVGASEIIARSAQMVGKGIRAKVIINWTDLIQYKKTFTDSIPKNTEQKFADLGIHMFHGAATFLSKNTIQVGKYQLQADHIVVATGQRPQPLNIPGESLLIDSTGFMELERLPKKLVMIGGGYIAFEFAHIAARAGAQVTILHQGKRPLEGFDADLVNLLVKAMEAIGIRIELNAQVTAVRSKAGKLSVQYKQHGKPHSVSCQVAIHGAGRVADVAELAVEKANIEVSDKGIVVNRHMQSTSNPAIYACGDVADKGKPLTPLASYEGNIVADAILGETSRTFVDDPIPSAVFTIPTLASVGLTEEQAKDQKLDIKILFQETADWYTSRRINESFTGFKILVEKKTNQIIGAHLIGSGSDELINLFTLAMKHRLSAKDLSNTLLTYPTHASDLKAMLSE